MRSALSSVINAVALLFLFLILLLFSHDPLIVIIAPALLLLGIICFFLAKEQSPRRQDAIALIFLGVLGLLFGMDQFRQMLHPPREARHRAACQDNLRTIGRALDTYALANGGARPATLGALYPQFLQKPDLERLVCPSSEDSVGAPDRIDAWSSYECNSSGEEWVCREKNNEFHVPGGRNVLRPGGLIEFVKTDGRSCWENLHRISRALDTYAAANGDVRPEHLSALYPDYVLQKDLLLFVCPQDKSSAGPPESIDEWVSYEYNASSNEWICRDSINPYSSGGHRALQPDGHYSEGHNVLRPDGKIEFVKEAPPR